jgi:hypothetical protein
MSFLLRRCSHGTSRRVLSALLWSDPTRLVTPSTSAIIQQSPGSVKDLFGSVLRRDFHFSRGPLGFRATFATRADSRGPLGFRATFATRAEFSVDELYEEEKNGSSKKGDEGLEISKLGISDEIVSRLAKKEINKLFPIQVFFIVLFCEIVCHNELASVYVQMMVSKALGMILS